MRVPFMFVRTDNYQRIKSENERLKQTLASAVTSIQQLEKGDFATLIIESEHEIGNTIQELRSSLMLIEKKEREQRWTSEGISMFMDILRRNDQSLEKIAEEIVSMLVRYLKANQGALFVVTTKSKDDIQLELTACYAYGRKKFLERVVNAGDGLLGQAYYEKNPVYLTRVPNNYTKITSGLGEATPGALLIVPFQNNGEVMAVMELASFKPFAPYEIQFIEKIGEHIASLLTTMRVNQKTTELLKASQKQAEELKAQEEEMRQNVEELTAMQESQLRLRDELSNRLQDLENTKLQIEELKKAEAEKMKKQNEVQTRIMNATVEKFKKREADLLQQLQAKEQELLGYQNTLTHSN